MLPTISTPALAAETAGHQQQRQQWKGQDKENAESPYFRGQEEPLQLQQQPQQQQLPPSAQQQHHEGEQKEQGPAPFPLSNNPITSTTTDSTAPSSGSCPNLEQLVDTLLAQARCKFLDQFDEMTQTMSCTMKREMALRAEQERQRRAEWEASVNIVHKKEVEELRGSIGGLRAELDMLRLPMMDTPSLLRSGMLFMSEKDSKNPCGTPAVGARKPLGTPASRLSLFSVSSASGEIDVEARQGGGTSPSPFTGLSPMASAIKPLPSPLLPQLQQPQPQRQSQPLPSEPAAGVVATTSPYSLRPATPSSVWLTDARTAAYEGACSTTSNHAAAAAAADAAQSAWLAAYYSGNNHSVPSGAPTLAAAPALAPASSVASAIPACIASSVDIPSTFDSIMTAVDDHHQTAETPSQVSETVRQPAVVKAVTPPPAATVTTAVVRGVPDGGVTTKACGAPVIGASDASATVASMPEAIPPPPFVARLSSAGRRSSMPVGGLSRGRTSGSAGLPSTVFNENMLPPKARTPVSAKNAPMRFGAAPARSPLGEIHGNAVATRLSPAVNAVGIKKAAGDCRGSSVDGGFDCDGSMGSHDTIKANETVRDGKRQASAISASTTRKGDGDVVGTSPSPRKSSKSVATKRAKKVLPQSHRVLRSASRASRAAAAAATGATATATKHSSPRTSTAEAARPRATRSATLRSERRGSSGRGSFMRF